MTRTNNRPGICEREACRKPIPAGAGVLDKVNGRWVVWCRGCTPFQIPEPAPAVRELTATGQIRTPYEPENLNLLRSFPGAKWNAAGKFWTCSTEPADRARVIELASRMGLQIAPEMAAVPPPESFVSPHGIVPDGRSLFEFQNAGVAFLASRRAAILGDDMGTGKTVQTLIALPPAETARVVVVCPACVKFNWRNEAAVWRPDLRTTVLEDRGSFRLPAPGEIVVVNYDILPSEVPDGWTAAGISLVADEAHMVKNYKAQRSKKIAALAKNAARVWFLSGTPLLNRPFDLMGVLSAAGLFQAVFGGFAGFLRAFNGTPGRWGGYEFGPPEPYVAEKLRNVMLRRRKDEVLPDLPPKIYQNLAVNGLSAGLRRRLDEIWEGEDIALRNETDDLPPFERFSAIRAELAEAKIPALLELAEQYEESDTPVVVFSAHRAPVLTLGERPGWAAITGDTTPEERTAIVAQFQGGVLRGVALTIAAGGVGLTLTRASTVIFADLDWTPALNLQAEDRCHRIG
jgi:SWI/SNF-related matrix-associated actin-dependent regulator 1 of chromatin subfamily A